MWQDSTKISLFDVAIITAMKEIYKIFAKNVPNLTRKEIADKQIISFDMVNYDRAS